MRSNERDRIREAARTFEQALPPEQRKQLGQFFSGIRLGKLLAHLSLHPETRTVLDPMAGHGDLLDATWEAATESELQLRRLDGIEIDQSTAAVCGNRLTHMASTGQLPAQNIIVGDAFDPDSIAALQWSAYDLVITNPPYVRYQARNASAKSGDKARSGVAAVAAELLSGADSHVWNVLAEGYSGLADLSVPAWLLSGLMVRPGGRLALVVPATWRSRDYADVIRYLLLRCFTLELIVEDKQPGWFSDALVRTHLIVARRLYPEESGASLSTRSKWQSALWLQIAPKAADGRSLVGAAFGGNFPEREFATWVRDDCADPKDGISVRRFALGEEWASLRTHVNRRRWYHQLERTDDDLPLFLNGDSSASMTIPDALRDILPSDFSSSALVTLEQTGIQVGQGLRTGCNFFFYVTACGPSEHGVVPVKASSVFNQTLFSVPAGALEPVLRRQSEMAFLESRECVLGRVLDLRQWVLPQDAEFVARAKQAYAASGKPPPRIMPDELANYVAMAATIPLPEGKFIPQLSAVRTNVRLPDNEQTVPRFWYMLPDFAQRHLPAAFVPRVNHGLAWVEANCDPPILIDANFSTFWSPRGNWSRHAIKALLNSAWCRAFMEAIGTPLGGGALKLEATHLRRMPVPVLSDELRIELDTAGRNLTRDANDVQSRIDGIILDGLLSGFSSRMSYMQLAKAMTDRAQTLSSARQKAA